MRIAMITPGFLPAPATKGGAVECLITELLKCNEEKNDIDIDIYSVPDADIEKLYNFSKTKIYQIKINKITKIWNAVRNRVNVVLGVNKWNTSYARTISRLMKNKQYDYVIVHNNLIAFREILENTPNKDNLIYVLHNDVPEGTNERILAKLISEKAYKILAVSNYTKNMFIKLFPNDKTEVLYNCLDKAKYLQRFSQNEIKEIRSRYGIEDEEIVFIYSGRLDRYKGVLELLKAFKKMEGNKCKLLIVGKSWFDADVVDDYTKKLIKEAEDIRDKVIFSGFINPKDMPKMYQMSDVLVVPSIWEEPFGVVAIEGMASGLPLIVTNSGGLQEIVSSHNAIVVDKEHIIDNLVAAMRRIFDDSNLRKSMSEASKKIIEETDAYDSKKYLDNLLIACEIYK